MTDASASSTSATPGAQAALPAAGTSGSTADDPAFQAILQDLGVDPEHDRALIWIVEVGLQSPIPPKWEAQTAPDTGYVYYVNRDTQQSQWENPLLPYVRQVIDIARMYLQSPSAHVINEQINLLSQGFREGLAAWHGPYIAEGKQ